jgi:hypothetical protein
VKATLDAYRLPIWVVRVARHGRVLLWGCARPARAFATPQIDIQFAPAHAAFTRLTSVTTQSPRGYFQTWITLPRSGAIRLAWTYPGGQTVYSRTVAVSIR